MSWNVNGLKNIVNEQGFLNTVKKYDIIGLCETWTTNTSEIDIKGYKKFHVPSISKKRGRKSGGIVVYVNNNLCKGITCTKKDNNLIWMKLHSSYFGWRDDIHLAVVYCPPKGSPHNDDQLENLQHNITELSKNSKILIMGDLNARVGEMSDYITNDEIDNHVSIYTEQYSIDEIPRKRQTCDLTINEFGKQLIDINICNQLRILNGRFLGDSMGRYTFYSHNGASTIDYGICHNSIIQDINYFSVLPLTEYSDHCQIVLSFKCDIRPKHKERTTQYKTIPVTSTPKWHNNSKDIYS